MTDRPETRPTPAPSSRPCSNEGCLRPAARGEAFCDTCQLERALFRRDERPSCLSGRTAAAPGR